MQAKDMNFKYWSDLGHGDAFCHVLLAGGTNTQAGIRKGYHVVKLYFLEK